MKRYGAEPVGMFMLVLGGCGSAVLASEKIGFTGVCSGYVLMMSSP
jgi:glycerol uptake facilitator-like aquaporin